jgi:hypothetical protein
MEDGASWRNGMREHDVGAAAGRIWSYLEKHGPSPVPRVVRGVEGSRELVWMGLGWLAREGKLGFQEEGRRRLVSLKP